MIIAIASGKGGTGKTTLATNLAHILGRETGSVELLDCDVEEPNCHIFSRPKLETSAPVTTPIPHVEENKCTGCGICGEVCQYSAIVCLKGKVLVFPELCHGCGGCVRFCPENAIREEGREVGVVQTGRAAAYRFVQGKLKIGEVMAPPVIRAVKNASDHCDITIIDAPPGTSCPVIEAVKDADFVLLATEATPFGLNDLKLAVEMVRALNIPFAVAVNRCDTGDNAVKDYCQKEGIRVLLEIPDDRRIAEAYSVGKMISDVLPDYRQQFFNLFDSIRTKTVGKE